VSETSHTALPRAGNSVLLADRYIEALYTLAAQNAVVDAVLGDMINLQKLWDESADWRDVATNPRLSREVVSVAAEQVARIVGVHKITANFMSVVAQNRRLSLLPLFIERFIDEVGMHRGEYRADVHTASPLSAAQRDRLLAILGKATGGKIRLVEADDPSLIGGLTVKIGSKFVDASVRTKLDRLEYTLRGKTAAA